MEKKRCLEKQNKTTITKKILNEKKTKRRENEKGGLPSGIEHQTIYAPRHMLPLGDVRT